MFKKIFKFFVISIGLLLLAWFAMIFISKTLIGEYLNTKFFNEQRPIIIEAFEKTKASPTKKTLILGADIIEGDVIAALEKGHNVIAYESLLNGFTLNVWQPNHFKRIDKLDFDTIPPLDLVMASFILPFHPTESFEKLWKDIDQKIKIGGYFVGNFFDPRFEIFKDPERSKMTFHTKTQVLELFKSYKIIKIEEIQNQLKSPAGLEYYYEVLAQKVK